MLEPTKMLDRYERAAMAYERLGSVKRDDEKTRRLREDAVKELTAARNDILLQLCAHRDRRITARLRH